MALTIVTLQFHYGGCFVSDPTLRHLNQNQSPIVEEQSPLVEEQAPGVEEHSAFDSLYDVNENIDDWSDLDKELLQARQSNIQEQVKEKADKVNLDEIPSDPVDLDSDISEDEGDPVENDEVVDPAPRKESTKIYFDPTTKKKNAGTSTVGISAVIAETNTATSDLTNAAIGSQSSVNAGSNACPSARRPTNALSNGVRPATALTSGGKPISAISGDVRPATTSTFCGKPTTTPLSGREELQLLKDNYERRVTEALKAQQTLMPRQELKAHIDFTLFSLMA
ncbi:hypothetical protein KY285_027308 [Solanum tuberosum]|nr:hypothetical protein KY285_027308 [Solanum tuberosum]